MDTGFNVPEINWTLCAASAGAAAASGRQAQRYDDLKSALAISASVHGEEAVGFWEQDHWGVGVRKFVILIIPWFLLLALPLTLREIARGRSRTHIIFTVGTICLLLLFYTRLRVN